MPCCGKVKKRKAIDKNGNSLKKYAYLNPNQKKLLEAQEQQEQDDKQEG